MEDFSITILRKRIFAVVIALALLFICIFGRLLYVQVIWGENLQEKALDQWTREIPVIANRGKIVDRNGVVLTYNDDTYTVFARKRAIGNLTETASVLSKVLGIDYDLIYDRLTKTVSSEITVKKQVQKTTIDNLMDYNLSGIYFSRDNSRLYPYGEFLSSVIGFTSNDGKGQSGLELYYDKYLSGINGEVLYETDIVGIDIEKKTASYIPATNGLNLKLTIDYEIQQLCENAMNISMREHNAKSCQMIVLDPSNGEILAMCNKPSLDLNNIPRDNLQELNKLIRNNIVCDMYEPGSTFKTLTACANIEEYLQGNKNAFSNEHIFNSGRYRIVGGQKIKCWSNHQNGKHANLNLQGALNNSCNPIFVDIATSLGKDVMYKYINLFGYGKTTGIDFNGESQGMILNKNSIELMDLARISFGQTIAVSALQLAFATASMVNGGKYYEPHLVKEIYDEYGNVAEKIYPKLKNKTISEKASEIISQMLETVVEKGSGSKAYIEGYRVGGKTGTAQKYENGVIAQGKYVSSFVGFFPSDNPKYLALVIVDEPEGQYYGSTVAAPYAKQVFEGIISLKKLKPS